LLEIELNTPGRSLGANGRGPKATLEWLSAPLYDSGMKKVPARKSRRRSKQSLGRRILVYFTQAERDLIDKAADLERRSTSSFIANAAITAAERIVDKRK